MRIYGKIKNKILASSYIFFNPINKIKFILNGVKYGRNVRVRGTIDIRHPDNGEIVLGNNILINSAPWANPIGFADKTRFELFDEGSIYVGDYVGMSNVAIASSSEVRIGNNVLIGAGTKIYGTDFHPISVKYRDGKIQTPGKTGTKAIIIEDGVFIGAGCIIMKGVQIGKNSVIGAGSIVTKKIPENQVWAGNPAVFIKTIDNQ